MWSLELDRPIDLATPSLILLLAAVAFTGGALRCQSQAGQSQEISVAPVGIVTYPGIDAARLSPDGKKVAVRRSGT
jgi:hypothetical protein